MEVLNSQSSKSMCTSQHGLARARKLVTDFSHDSRISWQKNKKKKLHQTGLYPEWTVYVHPVRERLYKIPLGKCYKRNNKNTDPMTLFHLS